MKPRENKGDQLYQQVAVALAEFQLEVQHGWRQLLTP